MRSAVIIVVLLGGALLWGQSAPAAQSTPPPKKPHVITNEELEATRPPDFKPSVEAAESQPQGDADQANKESDQAGAGEAAPAVDQAKVDAVKQQEAEQQQKIDDLQAKLASATTPAEKETYSGALANAKTYLTTLQKQRAALEHPGAAPAASADSGAPDAGAAQGQQEGQPEEQASPPAATEEQPKPEAEQPSEGPPQ